MALEGIDSVVEAFFASYRAAFERSDVEAIAGHFGDSVHIASDTGSGVRLEVATGPRWRATVEQLVWLYRTLDVGRAEIRALKTIGLSPRLAQASVEWALFDRRGDALYEFRALYTLAGEGPSCRIVAIAHDELPQSRQYLTRRHPPGVPPDGTSSASEQPGR